MSMPTRLCHDQKRRSVFLHLRTGLIPDFMVCINLFTSIGSIVLYEAWQNVCTGLQAFVILLSCSLDYACSCRVQCTSSGRPQDESPKCSHAECLGLGRWRNVREKAWSSNKQKHFSQVRPAIPDDYPVRPGREMPQGSE